MLLSGGAQGYGAPSFPLQALLLALFCLAFGVWLVSSVRRAERQRRARDTRGVRVASSPLPTAYLGEEPSVCRLASAEPVCADAEAPALPLTAAGSRDRV